MVCNLRFRGKPVWRLLAFVQCFLLPYIILDNLISNVAAIRYQADSDPNGAGDAVGDRSGSIGNHSSENEDGKQSVTQGDTLPENDSDKIDNLSNKSNKGSNQFDMRKDSQKELANQRQEGDVSVKGRVESEREVLLKGRLDSELEREQRHNENEQRHNGKEQRHNEKEQRHKEKEQRSVEKAAFQPVNDKLRDVEGMPEYGENADLLNGLAETISMSSLEVSRSCSGSCNQVPRRKRVGKLSNRVADDDYEDEEWEEPDAESQADLHEQKRGSDDGPLRLANGKVYGDEPTLANTVIKNERPVDNGRVDNGQSIVDGNNVNNQDLDKKVEKQDSQKLLQKHGLHPDTELVYLNGSSDKKETDSSSCGWCQSKGVKDVAIKRNQKPHVEEYNRNVKIPGVTQHNQKEVKQPFENSNRNMEKMHVQENPNAQVQDAEMGVLLDEHGKVLHDVTNQNNLYQHGDHLIQDSSLGANNGGAGNNGASSFRVLSPFKTNIIKSLTHPDEQPVSQQKDAGGNTVLTYANGDTITIYADGETITRDLDGKTVATSSKTPKGITITEDAEGHVVTGGETHPVMVRPDQIEHSPRANNIKHSPNAARVGGKLSDSETNVEGEILESGEREGSTTALGQRTLYINEGEICPTTIPPTTCIMNPPKENSYLAMAGLAVVSGGFCYVLYYQYHDKLKKILHHYFPSWYKWIYGKDGCFPAGPAEESAVNADATIEEPRGVNSLGNEKVQGASGGIHAPHHHHVNDRSHEHRSPPEHHDPRLAEDNFKIEMSGTKLTITLVQNHMQRHATSRADMQTPPIQEAQVALQNPEVVVASQLRKEDKLRFESAELHTSSGPNTDLPYKTIKAIVLHGKQYFHFEQTLSIPVHFTEDFVEKFEKGFENKFYFRRRHQSMEAQIDKESKIVFTLPSELAYEPSLEKEYEILRLGINGIDTSASRAQAVIAVPSEKAQMTIGLPRAKDPVVETASAKHETNTEADTGELTEEVETDEESYENNGVFGYCELPEGVDLKWGDDFQADQQKTQTLILTLPDTVSVLRSSSLDSPSQDMDLFDGVTSSSDDRKPQNFVKLPLETLQKQLDLDGNVVRLLRFTLKHSLQPDPNKSKSTAMQFLSLAHPKELVRKTGTSQVESGEPKISKLALSCSSFYAVDDDPGYSFIVMHVKGEDVSEIVIENSAKDAGKRITMQLIFKNGVEIRPSEVQTEQEHKNAVLNADVVGNLGEGENMEMTGARTLTLEKGNPTRYIEARISTLETVFLAVYGTDEAELRRHQIFFRSLYQFGESQPISTGGHGFYGIEPKSFTTIVLQPYVRNLAYGEKDTTERGIALNNGFQEDLKVLGKNLGIESEEPAIPTYLSKLVERIDQGLQQVISSLSVVLGEMVKSNSFDRNWHYALLHHIVSERIPSGQQKSGSSESDVAYPNSQNVVPLTAQQLRMGVFDYLLKVSDEKDFKENAALEKKLSKKFGVQLQESPNGIKSASDSQGFFDVLRSRLISLRGSSSSPETWGQAKPEKVTNLLTLIFEVFDEYYGEGPGSASSPQANVSTQPSSSFTGSSSGNSGSPISLSESSSGRLVPSVAFLENGEGADHMSSLTVPSSSRPTEPKKSFREHSRLSTQRTPSTLSIVSSFLSLWSSTGGKNDASPGLRGYKKNAEHRRGEENLED